MTTVHGDIVRMRVGFIEDAAEKGDFTTVLELLTVFKQDVEYLAKQATLAAAKNERENLAV